MFFYLSSVIQGAGRIIYKLPDVKIGQWVWEYGNGVSFRKRSSSEQ